MVRGYGEKIERDALGGSIAVEGEGYPKSEIGLGPCGLKAGHDRVPGFAEPDVRGRGGADPGMTMRGKATLGGFAALVARVGQGELRSSALQALERMGGAGTRVGFTEASSGEGVRIGKGTGTGHDAETGYDERDGRHLLESILESIACDQGGLAGDLVRILAGKLGHQAVVDLFTGFLRSRDWKVRAGAAACLDVIGAVPRGMDAFYYWTAKGEWDKCVRAGRAALDSLLSLLHPYQDEQALECAMSAAAEIRDSRVVAVLDDLAEIGGPRVRKAAARALGKTGTRKAVEPLVNLLGDEDPSVAEEAGRSLVNLGEFSVEALAELLTEDDERLRKRAVELLSLLGEDKRVEPLVFKVLLSRLKDGDRTSRNRIASALAHASGRWAVDILIEALFYYHVRVVAHRALLQKGREALDQLMGALKHRHVFVRREAALILGELGDPRAWDALRAATRDRDWHVKEAASRALSMLESRYSLIRDGEVVRVVEVSALPDVPETQGKHFPVVAKDATTAPGSDRVKGDPRGDLGREIK